MFDDWFLEKIADEFLTLSGELPILLNTKAGSADI